MPDSSAEGDAYRLENIATDHSCEELLDQSDLPERLRNRISDYADTIRNRRANWYESLVEADAEV